MMMMMTRGNHMHDAHDMIECAKGLILTMYPPTPAWMVFSAILCVT
jgi:hypothetical protein